jgi:2-polyprenyl-3-methyl-5-hydroxy-6-metoxy-1,4-benzoquinol methylase
MDHSDNWPKEELEKLFECPICKSEETKLMFSNVKDWSFKCAPGDWMFYSCSSCNSLFINPRPTEDSIHKAYKTYYTHELPSKNEKGPSFSLRIYNEYMFHAHGIGSVARLNLKNKLAIKTISAFVYRKFPLDQLSKLPRGSILDVGCGDGEFLTVAKEMGFLPLGIEIDLQAYLAAKNRGLNVLHGSYKTLENLSQKFDYIVCSHVIEHVHDPVDFIEKLVGVAKPSSTIFLSWPNPDSIILSLFKKYWRGLEAPRHISLPSEESIRKILSTHGWSKIKVNKGPIQTFGPSILIKYGRLGFISKFINKMTFAISSIFPMSKRQDIMELICQQQNSDRNN